MFYQLSSLHCFYWGFLFTNLRLDLHTQYFDTSTFLLMGELYHQTRAIHMQNCKYSSRVCSMKAMHMSKIRQKVMIIFGQQVIRSMIHVRYYIPCSRGHHWISIKYFMTICTEAISTKKQAGPYNRTKSRPRVFLKYKCDHCCLVQTLVNEFCYLFSNAWLVVAIWKAHCQHKISDHKLWMDECWCLHSTWRSRTE